MFCCSCRSVQICMFICLNPLFTSVAADLAGIDRSLVFKLSCHRIVRVSCFFFWISWLAVVGRNGKKKIETKNIESKAATSDADYR